MQREFKKKDKIILQAVRVPELREIKRCNKFLSLLQKYLEIV
jgi:hypothetical protein